MKSTDIIQNNIKKLKTLFPETVINNKVDFDKLHLILGDDINSTQELYNFSWNGKQNAINLADSTTTAILKPNKNKSKNWNTTKNIYIEGDNLKVLKILQKNYSNKIKLIYIDPPYNTGKKFIYKDSFEEPIKDYLKRTGQSKDIKNLETDGRYHTNWLNMIYPRLKLAKSLLTEDGVIFISINDKEQANLKKISDEIFGESNFLAQIIWERAYSPVNLKKNFSKNHEYILVYAKNSNITQSNGLKRSDKANSRYSNPDNDERGPWKSSDLSVGPAIEKNIYTITTPSGRKVSPPNGYSWRLSEKRFNEFVSDNRIWFGPNNNSVPQIKRFLSEVKQTVTPMTIWNYKDVGHSQSASQYLKRLFDNKAYFSYPKPVPLIQRIIELYSNKDSIILDFFSGSATTAEAVMQMNADDNGERKYIMVQTPEKLDKSSIAFKDGYKTIPDVAIARIDRAGDNLIKENPNLKNKLDIGFKVYNLSNYNNKTKDDT